jgi:hypothetical protein
VDAVAAGGAHPLVPIDVRARGIAGTWRRRCCHACKIADTVVGDVQARFVMLAMVTACRFGFDPNAGAGDGGAGDDAEGGDGDGDAIIDAPIPPNLVFVTSTTVDLCTGGVAAADAECMARAAAANLSGTYVSFTSDTTSDARDRLAVAAGWVRSDGRPVAATVDTLLGNGPWFPPRLDENGTELGPSFLVASATDGTGRLINYNPACNIGGRPSNTATAWFGGLVVGPPQHVVCFGVDRMVPVTKTVATGRLAFVTAGVFTPSSGIGAADALCTTEASNASLPGTYKAFMSTTTTPAASRFNLSGPAWVRTDGVPLMASASDLGTWSFLTALDRRIDGTVTEQYTWTGNPTTNTMAQTCNNWSSASMSVLGILHDAPESANFWTSFQNGCATTANVMCFQE